MRKLFLSFVAAMLATFTYAQTSLLATLSHDGNITTFYGANALRDAHEAAVSGDVITLSSGTFYATNITKAISLRGTGIDAQEPTIIINGFTINIPSTDTERLLMEGIRFINEISLDGTLINAQVIKCASHGMFHPASDNANINNITFINSKIPFTLYGNNNSAEFINSWLDPFYCNTYDNCAASFVNCLVRLYKEDPYYLQHSQLINCIIHQQYGDYGGSRLPSGSLAQNCVAIGYSGLFNDSQANTNCKYSTYEEMFKTFRGPYTDEETFELTDEAKTTFLGTDGKEVGMYGGSLPYDPTPINPQITKCNVASKTTADGKLSVDIEIKAAE